MQPCHPGNMLRDPRRAKPKVILMVSCNFTIVK